jgi:hypothetical protein
MIFGNYYVRGLALFVLLVIAAYPAVPGAPSYEELVQRGKGELQGGHPDQAAASGKAAIKMSTERWEGYALVGGALMNLKQYETAADTFSEAIKRAPESKQTALRDLRRQCLLAESGSPAAANIPAPVSATSQAEIVLWKSIENGNNLVDFQTYLTQYPHGAFSALAKQRLADAEVQAESAKQNERRDIENRYTWTDPSTGLMWMKIEPRSAYFWDHKFPSAHVNSFPDAQRYCAALRLAEYAEWRLPTSGELLNVYTGTVGKTQHGRMGDYVLYVEYSGLWTSSAGNKDGEHIAVRWGKPKSLNDRTAEIGNAWSGVEQMTALCVRPTDGMPAEGTPKEGTKNLMPLPRTR